MKSLYLIRHAKSSWDYASLKDHERPLGERGHHDAPLMAKHLVSLGINPDVIVSSDAKRALMTATYFANAYQKTDKDIILAPEIYDAHMDQIINYIKSLDNSWNTVFLFGHNPGFTYVADHFLKDGFIENVPTCGIVHLQGNINTWQLFNEKNVSLVNTYFPKIILKKNYND